MEGDSAVQAIFGPELDKYKAAKQAVPPDLQERIRKTRADYERWLDAKYAAARGHVDALIDPLETRRILAFALEICAYSAARGHLALQTL